MFDGSQPQPVKHEMLKRNQMWRFLALLIKSERKLTAFTIPDGGQYFFNGIPSGLVNTGKLPQSRGARGFRVRDLFKLPG